MGKISKTKYSTIKDHNQLLSKLTFPMLMVVTSKTNIASTN